MCLWGAQNQIIKLWLQFSDFLPMERLADQDQGNLKWNCNLHRFLFVQILLRCYRLFQRGFNQRTCMKTFGCCITRQPLTSVMPHWIRAEDFYWAAQLQGNWSTLLSNLHGLQWTPMGWRLKGDDHITLLVSVDQFIKTTQKMNWFTCSLPELKLEPC